MTTSVPAVRAEGLVKSFGSRRAVDHLDLVVHPGEVYGVLGPNGAGKTTFMRMLFGLIRPDEGTLEVFGRTWARDGVRTLDGVAGFIESPRFYGHLTGRRNLELLGGLDGGCPPARVDEVLDIVDLTGRDREKVRGYSFGMRQRLGVAAALLRDPQLLVLDEPANGLDPAGIRDMRALVSQLASSGLTVLLSSHDMAEVEQICSDVTIMRTGQVAYHGSIEGLRQQAPEQATRLRTSDDARATEVAGRLGLDPQPLDRGFAVTGTEQQLDALVHDLSRHGVAVRELTTDETPLEALFFMLTESGTESPSAVAA